MKLSGSYNLKAKKEDVWKALNNPEILKQCIPGCESFERENKETFIVTATNQIGPMNATFSGNITLSNIKENESYTLSGQGSSSVGFANGKANVVLEEKDGTTVLNYDVSIDVGGKIAQLGSRLIDAVGKKMSDYFFGRFSDIVSPIDKKTDLSKKKVNETRVKELKSNFLNKYIYLTIVILLLLTVVIFYFVSR